MVDGLAMMPDEHVGHVGHDDVAPAVAELLEGEFFHTNFCLYKSVVSSSSSDFLFYLFA